MQTAESITHIKFWTQVAEYYQSNASSLAIKMYARDTQNTSAQDLWQAWDEFRSTQKHTRMPLPMELKSILNPKLDGDDQAREAAARIITAIPKFGYMNGGLAREFIGELGWEVVKLQGGWGYLCQHHQSENDGVLQAQCRELSKAVATKAKRGELDQAPALPEKLGDKKALLDSTIAKLTESKTPFANQNF